RLCSVAPMSTPPSPPSLSFFLFFSMLPRPPISTLFPYTTLLRSCAGASSTPVSYCRGPSVPSAPSILRFWQVRMFGGETPRARRSEEHTSELQSLTNLVCRLLLEKKKQPDVQPHTPSDNTAAHAR